MQYNWKGDALAKLMIVLLVVLMIINSCIIAGLQVMVFYPHKSINDARSTYEQYNQIDVSGANDLSAVIFAAPGKTNRLMVTQKHFLANRHRILLDTEVSRHYSAKINTDLGTVSVKVKGNSEIEGLSIRSVSLPIRISTVMLRVPLSFLLWNLLLLSLEIAIAVLVHKIKTK